MLALVGASCSPMMDARGHQTEMEDLKQLVDGQSRTSDVEALLGSPSAKSTYGETIWYYISQNQERQGMLAPEVTKQNVVAIGFDEADTVKAIVTYDLKDGKPINIVSKTTPVEGREMTVLDQILGNVGRFGGAGRSMNPGSVGRAPGGI